MCTKKVDLNDIDHRNSAPPPSITPLREEDSDEEDVYLFKLKINYALRPSTTAIYPYSASKKLKIKGTFNTLCQSAKFYVIPGKGGYLLGKETSIKLDLLRLGPTRLEKCLKVSDCKISDSIPPLTQKVLDKHK